MLQKRVQMGFERENKVASVGTQQPSQRTDRGNPERPTESSGRPLVEDNPASFKL